MKLKLGLPKGSLQEPTFALFGRAGYSLKVSTRSYQPVIDDDTIEPILLRPQEIPIYVQEGVLDAGLTGKDWIEDAGAGVHEVCELRYSKMTNNPTKIVLAVHEDSPIKSVKDLQGVARAREEGEGGILETAFGQTQLELHGREGTREPSSPSEGASNSACSSGVGLWKTWAYCRRSSSVMGGSSKSLR